MLRNQLVDIDLNCGTGATITGTAVLVDKAVEGFAIQIVVSNATTPVGSLALQASCDPGPTPTNFGDIPDTATAISAAGTVIFHFEKAHFTAVRTKYVRTSGAATINSRINENA